MHNVTDEEFEKLIARAIDELPEKYITGLKNVLITYEDVPSPAQRKKLKLAGNQSLFGLYEGIPLTDRRGRNFAGVVNFQLPDRITIFKKPMIHLSPDETALFKQVKKTLWHEVAHYYGLNHEHIHELENKPRIKRQQG